MDFAVIGAQKCGTSTLTVLLGEHPGLCVPGNTAGFFDNDRYRRGREWMCRYLFAAAAPGQRCGTVSPQYMMGDVARTVERMAAMCPDIRLVAIVRDPIERAVSAYRMGNRRGQLPMSFDEAVLQDDTDGHGIVANGLYGRAVAPYAERFPAEQILVVTAEELWRDPAATVRAVFDHVGADPGFVPPSLGARLHQGGSRTRLTAEESRILTGYLEDHWFGTMAGAQRLQARAGFFHFFDRWNIVADDDRPEVAPATRDRLIGLYLPDAELLEPVMGRLPPWAARDAAGRLRWRGHAEPAR